MQYSIGWNVRVRSLRSRITSMPWATANDVVRSSSLSCRRSGSYASVHWLNLPSMLYEKERLRLFLRTGRRLILSGCLTSMTGVSQDNSGGVTASLRGIAIRATRLWSQKRHQGCVSAVVHFNRIRMFWIPGSAPGSGHSAQWVGRTGLSILSGTIPQPSC